MITYYDEFKREDFENLSKDNSVTIVAETLGLICIRSSELNLIAFPDSRHFSRSASLEDFKLQFLTQLELL